jgi:undecaprenyl pyrophosphate synthase
MFCGSILEKPPSDFRESSHKTERIKESVLKLSVVARLAEHVTVFQFLNERSNRAKQEVEFSWHHFWDKFRKMCGWCNRMWWRVLGNVRPKMMVNWEVCGC